MSNDNRAIQDRKTDDYNARGHRDNYVGREPFRVGDVNEEIETAEPVDDLGDSRNSVGNPGALDSRGSDTDRRGARHAEGLGFPDAVRISETHKTAPLKAKPKGKRAGKTVSTKEEADWLKAQFPRKLPGASGSWAVTNSGAGFTVDFRIDKRQNNGEPINFGFPRISREMFLTLKGMKVNECKTTVEKYVRGHLRDAIRQGDNRARIIAGKLRLSP